MLSESVTDPCPITSMIESKRENARPGTILANYRSSQAIYVFIAQSRTRLIFRISFYLRVRSKQRYFNKISAHYFQLSF